jgi:hypothetical protein
MFECVLEESVRYDEYCGHGSTFIRPLLEYADVVLDTKTQILINKLENVQIEAARIVTVGTRLVSLSNLYIEAGWEKLKDRRERHRTIQFYKMSNNLTPQYLSSTHSHDSSSFNLNIF